MVDVAEILGAKSGDLRVLKIELVGDNVKTEGFLVARSGEGVLQLTRNEALDLAAMLIASADRDAAEHVRAGPLGMGAPFVERLRSAAASVVVKR